MHKKVWKWKIDGKTMKYYGEFVYSNYRKKVKII